MNYKQPMIKPSERGSLLKIAKKSDAVKKDGKINRSWMREKLSSSSAYPEVKKKVNFALNFGK
ncbi:MAG: hypothetical protein GY746_10810 [Gammaproteobacteria bacterium]|nr:hypothetical protein [Gammaproteobacteria bacterium]